MNCHEVREQLFSYLDGELEARVEHLEAHLEECIGCYKRVTLERAFMKVVKARSAGRPVPERLEQRIREEISSRSPGEGFWDAPGPRSLLILAAACLLVTVLGFTAIVRTGGPAGTPHHAPVSYASGPVIPVQQASTLEGTLVCVGCAVACTKDRQVNHDHRNGIRTADGRIWHILETDLARPLVRDRTHLGEDVRVEGTLYTQAQTISVSRYRY